MSCHVVVFILDWWSNMHYDPGACHIQFGEAMYKLIPHLIANYNVFMYKSKSMTTKSTLIYNWNKFIAKTGVKILLIYSHISALTNILYEIQQAESVCFMIRTRCCHFAGSTCGFNFKPNSRDAECYAVCSLRKPNGCFFFIFRKVCGWYKSFSLDN